MRIVVCIKQVPDTNEVRIDPVKGTLIREGVPSIMNPDDKNALEEALRLKDEYGATVIVVTMGPPQAEKVLREALAMGADEAYLLTDRLFAGADTWATSLTLARAIQKIGYDLIFAGRQAIDGDTAQVGSEIAEHLNIPQVTYVEKVEIEKDSLRIKRALEDGYEIIRIQKPCLLTCIKELNNPRYMNIYDIFTCYQKEIKILTTQDLELDKEEIGLSGSPTKVRKTFTKEPKGKGEIINLPPVEAAQYAANKLKEKHFI
ncbi:Acryloyl-CoA reductase electron transfer subunit gamma [Caloramator mitchellensis]|uniref:Electron transfer flavoprotein small subunit n=1 Tax=Caloramator mitchellensis TaxID=908809 RepID=A0A0R3JY22_CALMK|nr:electron transfer flavoprotein subunit beta/FixA family protein [Caloramator mitchellensis]KRQ86110.1 Acryloyl-CoA reductase electron transfer subunit gamma [Caloramator mitchellensis]